MKILFDGTLEDESAKLTGLNDRGLQYGDGLFETMIYTEGQIRHIGYHVERLEKGASVLGLDTGQRNHAEWLKEQVENLASANELSGDLRIKWQVWRRPGGLYRPASAGCHEMILVSSHTPRTGEIQKAGFSDNVRLCRSAISPYKTISALPYVMASVECEKQKMDDLVLLSAEGHVAECLYSNLFWGKGREVYTPSLNSGCIGGVRRRIMMELLPEFGFSIDEVEAKPEDLLRAGYAFTTNAAAITPVKRLNDRMFGPVPEEILNLPGA